MEQLTSETAYNVLDQALNVANKKGAYTIEEASLIFNSLTFVKLKLEDLNYLKSCEKISENKESE